MAQVVIARKAAKKIAEIRAYYAQRDEEAAGRAVEALVSAFRPLQSHPQMGRPAGDQAHLRELIIPFGATGFVALYRIDERNQRVVILAIRHQREAGYA
jgi:plasmid stabilization system protein ParE